MSTTKSTAKRPAAKPKSEQAGAGRPVTETAGPAHGAASSLDEASGAAALARLRPQLIGEVIERPRPIGWGVRQGAAAGLGLVQLCTEHKLRPSLEALAQAGLFDLAHLAALPDLAQALWYVRHRLEAQTALSSEATLPAPLVAAALQLRRRMLRVLHFHFEEDPAIAARLRYIRSGAGYHDLADDLIQLAGLYDEQQAVLAGTPAPYDKKDQAQAAQRGREILAQLGLGAELDKTGARLPTDTASWSDLQRRLALLLDRSYEEVAAAARYICRHDEALVGRFGSLGRIARARPRPSSKSDPASPEDPSDLPPA